MGEKISDKGANQEIMKAFQLFDDDNTGKISFANLKRVAKELGENISEEELQVSHNSELSIQKLLTLKCLGLP